jgi:hypothetical protein
MVAVLRGRLPGRGVKRAHRVRGILGISNPALSEHGEAMASKDGITIQQTHTN